MYRERRKAAVAVILGQTRPQLGPGCVLRHYLATGECQVEDEAQTRAKHHRTTRHCDLHL